MNLFHITITTAASSLVAALFVQSAAAADAANGQRLAERWCSACHVVTTTQRQAYSDAPPFDEIAHRPAFTETGTVRFLLNPHAKMPDINLTRDEASDIAAYIGRQK
jgi:mono/diheme cytochrome c family protein